jgi:hypothetical protein
VEGVDALARFICSVDHANMSPYYNLGERTVG